MEQNPSKLIKIMSDRMKANGGASLKEKNITFMQSGIIRHLGKNGGKATQKEIEDYLHVSHPTVVGIISRMEKNGFLTCHTDENDKRQKVVELTDKAFVLAAQIRRDIDEHEKEMVAGFSDEEIEQLMSFLERIYNNVDAMRQTIERGKIDD